MTVIKSSFRSQARDLAAAVASHQRPLTFVLGAGASLSSGAPTTPQVHERLEQVTRGRFKGHVRDHLHDLTRREVRDHLRPLFADVVPDAGYRLLAAIGRHRRVNLIYLNWDDAAFKACEAIGTSVAVFDPLRGDTLEATEAKLPDGEGVLIVHVHGRIDDDARYGTLDTLPNRPEIWAAVGPLLEHDTVICGASLTGDLDVADVIERISNRDRDAAATWLFTRPGGAPPIVRLPSAWHRVDEQDVDFDDLMVLLAEKVFAATGVVEACWDELADNRLYLGLPRSDGLIELAPHLRRMALDARAAALVAPPFSGKSVGAVRLAHLQRLIHGVAEPLRVSLEVQDSVSELAISAARGDIVTVIDDPFGRNAPEMNPRVSELLLDLLADDDLRSFVCISSPAANWEAAARALLEDHPGLYVSTRGPAQWYQRERLVRLADDLPHRRPARRRAESSQVETPPEVLEIGRTGKQVDPKRRVADKRRLLEESPTLAMLACLVRLQERRHEPAPPAELSAILGCDPDDITGMDALLVSLELDGRRFWAFDHSTSSQAVDDYLAEHLDDVRTRLADAAVVPIWGERTLASWALAAGLPSSVANDLVPTGDLEPADWMAQRLGPEPDESDLAQVPLNLPDDWATIEFAYELVRVWDAVRQHATGRQMLADLLERPMGVYGLLEGCLYFGVGAGDELWARVTERLYTLLGNGTLERELLLCLDAVMWRLPEHQPLRDWAAEMLDELDPLEPSFAVIRFAAGYHPDGLAALDSSRALDIDASHTWTPEQAEVGAWLVAWHFAHQSRARVLLHRRTNIDKGWLCQSLGTDIGEHDHHAARVRLVQGLAQYKGSAGWAFHLACNLSAMSCLDLRDEHVQAVVRGALERAPSLDPGVLSATLSYRGAALFTRALKSRFADAAEREALLDAMSLGLVLRDGIEVRPSRFRYISDANDVHQVVGITWNNLDPELPRRPRELAAGLWDASTRILEGRSSGLRRKVATTLEQIERGDFRPVPDAARHKPSGDVFADALQRIVEALPSEQDDSLF